LCCLHADMLGSLGPKESKKAFGDFCHSFLDKCAILRVSVPPTVAFELDRTRPDLLSEDVQRQFVQEVVQTQQAAVSRQLEDFRSKKLMGMTPWEQELIQLGAWILSRKWSWGWCGKRAEGKLAAVVSAITLYMRHLGVRTKSVMGNRRSEEPTKTKKGLSSFLDAARWNRGEPQGEKPGLTERKGGLGVPSRDRNVGPPGQDTPGVPLHPLSGDSPDREPGVDALPELGDPPPQGPASLEPAAPLESTEEGADTERCPGPELLVTEAAHVRMLRVLYDLFYQPMADGGFFSLEELQNIFPSLDELIEVHSLFLDRLMKRRQDSGYLIEEIGDVLLAQFDGTEGSWFQKISSRFCSRQSFALEQLKAKQRKEPRFCAFVQLKDMIPTEMQRLTKYPLLLQSIGQNTGSRRRCPMLLGLRSLVSNLGLGTGSFQGWGSLGLVSPLPAEEPAEREKVELAAECCREILHHVNQAVRDMEDLLVSLGGAPGQGKVHVLLLDDLLLLLQRQDERLLLKSHSRTLTPTPDGKTMLRPEAQIYELVAQTVSERKNWCALITETAGSLKVPARTSRPKHRPSPSSTREPLLSSSENGNGGREMPPADGRMERIFSALLPFCRPGPEGQLAAKALQK
ncbi:hypothetical protein E2I00_010989, partial [Balaenoptera physalus]